MKLYKLNNLNDNNNVKIPNNLYTVLVNAGIKSLEEFKNYTITEAKHIENMDFGMYLDLVIILHDNDIHLKDELEPDDTEYESALDINIAKENKSINVMVKPGDMVYIKGTISNNIYEKEITQVQIYKDETVYIDESDNEYTIDDFNKDAFLSKEEAIKYSNKI